MKKLITIAMVLMATLGAMAADTVRVAAVQCPSIMGKTADNLRNITNLVREAAARGAKIVVMPECAVQGYLSPRAYALTRAAQGRRWLGEIDSRNRLQ